MSRRRRSAAAVLLVVALGAVGCAASLEIEVLDAVDAGSEPTPVETPAPTPSAVPAETPTTESPEEPTVAPDPVATVETEPTATTPPAPTPVPTAVPTPVPIEFLIAPNADLLGIALGTDAATTIAGLEEFLGPATFDSEWYGGCPLNGEGADERLLQWGDLNVYFDLIDGEGVFTAWGYDIRVIDGGYPEIDLIILPGGARVGDGIDKVADAAGLEVRYDEVFDINRVGEPGWEVVSDAAPDAPAWGAFVPAVPACE